MSEDKTVTVKEVPMEERPLEMEEESSIDEEEEYDPKDPNSHICYQCCKVNPTSITSRLIGLNDPDLLNEFGRI